MTKYAVEFFAGNRWVLTQEMSIDEARKVAADLASVNIRNRIVQMG